MWKVFVLASLEGVGLVVVEALEGGTEGRVAVSVFATEAKERSEDRGKGRAVVRRREELRNVAMVIIFEGKGRRSEGRRERRLFSKRKRYIAREDLDKSKLNRTKSLLDRTSSQFEDGGAM